MSGQDLLQTESRPRVVVWGDAILDRYVWGNVHRLSPEAPVPVLHESSQEHRLGGAACVAGMLAAWGADARLVAAVGRDDSGRALRALLQHSSVDCHDVMEVADRPTTTKTRFVARAAGVNPQQLLRFDQETPLPLPQRAARQLTAGLLEQTRHADVLIVSDYEKGLVSPAALESVLQRAREAGVVSLVDPAAGADYRHYCGADFVTPNRREAGRATGLVVATLDDAMRAAEKLLTYGIANVVITLDRDGILWARRDVRPEHIPAQPRHVFDITGAGDTVIAALAYGLARRIPSRDAVEIANVAAGLQVERLGASTVPLVDVAAAMANASPAHEKVMSEQPLLAEIERRRAAGETIVMTNGCFDLLHPGHVAGLEHARAQGDCLVVGLNSNASVRALKGPGRPVIDERGRMAMLAALACVDLVLVFDEASVVDVVRRVRPDVLVKSGQYEESEVVGWEVVRGYGGRIVLAPHRPAYSTSRLLQQCAEACAQARAAT